MWCAKDEGRIARIPLDEFLNPSHVQIFFFGMAAKLSNKQEEVFERDTTAAEKRASDIFNICPLIHPIAYDYLTCVY